MFALALLTPPGLDINCVRYWLRFVISLRLKHHFKKNCFATQALSQTQKNVSEPQTGIEPQPSDLRWDALTIELPGLRWQREGQLLIQQSRLAVGLLSAIWVLVAQWLERLTGDQKVAGSIPVWNSETFFWVCDKAWVAKQFSFNLPSCKSSSF